MTRCVVSLQAVCTYPRPCIPAQTLAFLLWASQLPQHYDYVIKADTDTYLHPYNLQRLLHRLPRQRAYWGEVGEGGCWAGN